MINFIKSQIQSLKLSQKDNQASIHEGRTVNILGIAGSMREQSYSTRGLKLVLEEVKKYDSESDVLELRRLNLPLYDPSGDTSHEPSSYININNNLLERITTALKWADAFVLASPDYHGSMSGGMKNFLDYFWEDFAGKTFGYIVASHEKGLTVADQMRTAVRQCYGWSMPYNISINGEKDFDSEGNLVNSALAKRVKMLARDLVTYGTLIRGQFLQDIANNEISDTFATHYRDYYN
ncbi:MAG TPA: NAD(P)H-dependent oxidoreductase [Nitrososphaeraceae archaeon]|nr:NAD(P)H-dependent oxidoreductase [Nitrososphaeraceae archaeon]